MSLLGITNLRWGLIVESAFKFFQVFEENLGSLS